MSSARFLIRLSVTQNRAAANAATPRKMVSRPEPLAENRYAHLGYCSLKTLRVPRVAVASNPLHNRLINRLYLEPNLCDKRLMKYIWQQDSWPTFNFDTSGFQRLTLRFIEKTGRVDGLLSALPDSVQSETIVDLMVAEAIKSSEIEGEILSRPDVMSSIRNNLGLNAQPKKVGDRRAEGIAELMVRVRQDYARPLTKRMLFEWHSMLMLGTPGVTSGAWRTHNEPMQIVSGTMGDEQVHYEAPPSKQVPAEMTRFIRWFNDTAPAAKDAITSPPVRSALAHLYFESVHPFEDGNGRIGRALSEKALSQGLGRPILLSLSRSIDMDRSSYYQALKQAQRSDDATGWIEWFARMLLKAQEQAEREIEFSLKKTKLFNRVGSRLNGRQLKVVRRMLREGPEGFAGGMTAKKYMSITETSKPTATRDLQDLLAKRVFALVGGGRSTRYLLDL
jgi:Fic family protein